MDYISIKEKIEALLADAKLKLEAEGVIADVEVEVSENDLGDGESDVLKVFGSIGVTTRELGEDEVFYLSVDAPVYDGEVDEDEYNAAVTEFEDALAAVLTKLGEMDDKTEAIRELDREVDEELERKYREEVERQQRAAKRDLTVAIIATVAIVIVAVGAALISRLF